MRTVFVVVFGLVLVADAFAAPPKKRRRTPIAAPIPVPTPPPRPTPGMGNGGGTNTPVPPVIGGDVTLGMRVWNYASKSVGKKVGNGQCTELAMFALRAAGAKTTADFGVNGRNADYVWGARVTKLANVRPGDVIQFRNALFVSRTGRWEAYAQHTAVVSRNLGDGRITVYHQNVGSANTPPATRMKVQVHTINFSELTKGSVWFYHPVKR